MNQFDYNNEIIQSSPNFIEEPWLNSPRIDALRQVRNVSSGTTAFYGGFLYVLWWATTTISWLWFSPSYIEFTMQAQFPSVVRCWSHWYHSVPQNTMFCLYNWSTGAVIGNSWSYAIYAEDLTGGNTATWKITTVWSDWFTITWSWIAWTGTLQIMYKAYK